MSDIPPPPKKKNLNDCLEWPEYFVADFMAVVFLSAQRSKDLSSEGRVCIANTEDGVVGMGYNGMTNRCSDNPLPREGQKISLCVPWRAKCHHEPKG